jgi:hypothetical protein
MPRDCNWITAREGVWSEGGSGDLDISILGNNAFIAQLASEEVIWTFFLSVGGCIVLLGVTGETIPSGDIGTRCWTGEQGALAVVAAEECNDNTDLE